MTMDFNHEKTWALFHSSDGREWVAVFYEGDRDVFTDRTGVVWTRVGGFVRAREQSAAALLRREVQAQV